MVFKLRCLLFALSVLPVLAEAQIAIMSEQYIYFMLYKCSLILFAAI